jgi:hypothetical protein
MLLRVGSWTRASLLSFFYAVVGDGGKLHRLVLSSVSCWWLLEPRYDRDVFGVIAIPLISHLAVAAEALQGY